MNCPVCDDVKLREVEKEGILIDVCPSCKGVWLDRGELDKLMQGVREVRDEFNEWYEAHEPKRPAAYGQPSQPPIQPQVQQQPYVQPQQPYAQPGQPYVQQQYGQQPYNKHQGHYPYGKHKKKKTVMDIFGDLFD